MPSTTPQGLQNAKPYLWEYANAAARTGDSGFTSDDVGKLARQTDDNSLWLLTGTTPTWVQVMGGVGIAGSIAATQVAVGSGADTIGGSADFTRNGTSGQVTNAATGGASAFLGAAATGIGVDGEASGAAGWGAYGLASGAGGKGVVGEVTQTDGVPLTGKAPAGQTGNLEELSVNAVPKWVVNAAGGLGTGTVAAAHVPDFDTQVRTSRLDQMAAAGADVTLNTHKLTDVVDPTSTTDAATKGYVDAVANGLQWKASCRAATTAPITLSGAQTIDGVSVVAGNRVLVKNQGTGTDAANGIYAVAAGAWGRALDADADAEVHSGLAVAVDEGSTQASTAWLLATANPITVGTTPLTFVALTGAGSGSVSSVGLTVPSGFSVAGSPITGAGTLAVSEDTQTANTVKAGPSSGGAATPGYRALVEADLAFTDITTNNVSTSKHGFAPKLPNDAAKYLNGAGAYTVPPGTGTVTSVAMTVPTDKSVSGSPITGAGTLAITDNVQAANKVKAGPATGADATPAYRALVAADLPATAVTPGSYTNTNLTVDAAGRLTAAANGTAGGGGGTPAENAASLITANLAFF